MSTAKTSPMLAPGSGVNSPHDNSIILALGAAVAQIMVTIMTASTSPAAAIVLLVLLFSSTTGLLIYDIKKYARSSYLLPVGIFAIGTAAAVVVAYDKIVGHRSVDPVLPITGATTNPPTQTQTQIRYYIRVKIYSDDHSSGKFIPGEKFIRGVQVYVRDPDDELFQDNYTDEYGAVVLGLRSIDGPVSIGACGVYQTHVISGEHTTKGNPYETLIGITLPRQVGCVPNP